MYSINVHFEDAGVQARMIKGVKAGAVLLEVLLQRRIAVRHDCGGVCHCTTCHVFIESGSEFLSDPTKRELDFLKRVKRRQPNSRLACQCLLTKGKGALSVTV